MKHVLGWAFPDADDFMCRELDVSGGYQASHIAAALAHVTDFSLAIDVGAHVGLWTKPLADRFDRVIALEPSPDTFRALQVNVSRLKLANVDLHAMAMGEKRGLVSMTWDAKQAARKNTGGRYIVAGGTIPCCRLDDWRLERLGFLKLDVEGSEYMALRGAVQTLRRCRPVVLFEDKAFGARYGHGREAPKKLLASLGYAHADRISHDEIWTYRC